MTPGRWQRVKEVLETAWECDPKDLAAFLDEACAGDAELRSQVEAMLASDRNADEFLAEPAIAAVNLPETPPPDEDLAGLRAGPYRILREIGHGGMGSVYLGERADGQYRKQVAVKLVSAHLNPEMQRRFRNELQVDASLDHPNIARLLDGGATESGVPYLVMEYVDGVRIDTWSDTHKLTVRERVQLFQQVCAAVQYAHEKQVIHRDIKPGNILVTEDGIPKLLDFGIAKVLNPELADSAETTLGLGPMTLEYASPEQVRGERVGTASDVYALGVLLYYLLSGRLPYSVEGRDLQEIARLICEKDPVKPSAVAPAAVRRQLAGDLDNIVMKALRKEPERRYGSVAEFSHDLDRILRDLPVSAGTDSLLYRGGKFLKRHRTVTLSAALTAAVVLALVTGLYKWSELKAPRETGVHSLAVLPLENLSGDREQESFAEGVTDALISDLARIRELRVISRTSVMSYKGLHRPIAEIARSLGVQTIAEGSVLRAGSRVRISIRLIDALRDRPVWSGSYEGELQDVLALQSQAAAAIAGEIDVTLTRRDQTRAPKHRRVDLGAYDAYLKGRHMFFTAFTQQNAEKAMAYFQQARELDPEYAPAYAGLAASWFMVSNLYFPPTVAMPKAKEAALKALELDDTLAEAHAMLAMVQSLYEFKRVEAGKSFQRAIELKPSDADTHLWYGQHLAGLSRFDDSLAQMEQARKLDPVSPALNAYVGLALYFARRYDKLIERLQPIADAHPEYHHPHAFIALACEQKREYAKAIAEMEEAYRLDSEPESLAQLGHMYALAGRTADARKVLKQLEQLARKKYVSAYNFAVLYAGLGERDEAFRWLGKVERDRSEWFAAVNVDPRLDELHSDPRFAAVLRSVGLIP